MVMVHHSNERVRIPKNAIETSYSTATLSYLAKNTASYASTIAIIPYRHNRYHRQQLASTVTQATLALLPVKHQPHRVPISSGIVIMCFRATAKNLPGTTLYSGEAEHMLR